MAKLFRDGLGNLQVENDAGGGEPATTTTPGTMSAADKVKLDALEEGGQFSGSMQPPVADATTEAEAVTQLNDLLAKLRILGIIDTSPPA